MRLSRFVVVGLLFGAPACKFELPLDPVDAAAEARPDILTPDTDTGGRVVDEHLIGLWRFADGAGAMVRDTVAALRPGYTRPPMDLTIETSAGVEWVPGGLRIDQPAIIRSPMGAAARPHMTPDVLASGAITLEVWVTPANDQQGGGAATNYAQVFALSPSASYCNIRLAQAGTRYFGSARTATATLGGEGPARSEEGAVSILPQQLVLVIDATTRRLYVDGVPADAAIHVGAPVGWTDNYRIIVGNEVMVDRAWSGTLWLAAVYDRALTPDEIARNRAAGYDCSAC